MILGTFQKIGIRNGVAHRGEGRVRSLMGARFRFLVLAGLGMMIFLLSGCGSDSTSKDVASEKKEKAAQSGSTMKTVKPLLSPKGSGTAPPLPQVDLIPGRPFPGEELEAKRQAAASVYEKLDPKEEVLPGLTKEQLEAKLENERAKKPDPNREIVSGLTLKQVDAKLKAHREQAAKPVEIFPGLTAAKMRANAVQAGQTQEPKSMQPDHVFPSR